MAGALGARAHSIARPTIAQKPKYYAMEMLPVSVGRSARRPREELYAGRCGRTHDAHARLQRAASHGLGRVRPTGRECRDSTRRRPGGVDGREHPEHAPPASVDGHQLRLVARDRDLRARVLSLESVALSAVVRTRSRVQTRGAGQLVVRTTKPCSPTSKSSTGAAGAATISSSGAISSQWFLQITAYADRLLAISISSNGWPERTRTMQRNWIGRSEGAKFAFASTASMRTSTSLQRALDTSTA